MAVAKYKNETFFSSLFTLGRGIYLAQHNFDKALIDWARMPYTNLYFELKRHKLKRHKITTCLHKFYDVFLVKNSPSYRKN